MQRCSRCLSLLIQHVSHPVSPFVVLFNLFDCIFLQLNTVVIHHCVLAANFCLCFWLLGFGPFLVGLLFLLAKRKSGWGICGSSWLGVCVMVLMSGRFTCDQLCPCDDIFT